ncbi:MAG TPA: ABC transporter substrate-binding protein [Acidimicrobiales bacterium]|nr:ABC transporter substrate-binding protein [Acidimicrobiales bacterium]
MSEFKKVTGITVNTDVLPLATFYSVESTQLAAGTAPDLVFNQATYQPYMVVPLNSYLNKPNPFVPGNKTWLSEFNPSAFSAKVSSVLDTKGNFDWVPFNLVGIAMYYNETAFKNAGITAPIGTFTQLMSDCAALKKAGYTPMAMDNSVIGTAFPYRPILDQLAQKQFSELNHFNVTGGLGTAPQLTLEDLTWGIATGKFSATNPYEQESVVLLKQLFTNCATANWSGITGLSGDGVGLPQFESGKAAMTFAVDFGYGTIAANSKFPIGSMPFPEITTATTPLSANRPAQSGNTVGGTSYMIPAHTSGNALKAAIMFLQFMSAPQYISNWLAQTGGIPAISGITAPASTAAYFEGAWGQPEIIAPFASNGYYIAPGVLLTAAYDGYLLGAKTLSQEDSYLEGLFQQGAAYLVKNDGWSTEPWAKSLPSS